MANYRRWIYSVNCSIIIVELLLVAYVVKTISEEWWYLIPIKLTNPTFVIYSILMIVQFFTCIGGLIGVLVSNSYLLSAYWMFVVPLLILDGVMIVPLVEYMSGVHRSIAEHIHNVTTQQVKAGDARCDVWNAIQVAHNCCSPHIVHGFCQLNEEWKRPRFCASPDAESCVFPILRMMHTETDVIAIIIYYVLVPLKFVVVFVLRKDVSDVFMQIVYKPAPYGWDWTTEDDDAGVLEDVYSNYSTKRSIGPELAAVIARARQEMETTEEHG
ncbi:hypothetical protein Aduo_019708 [Ancylostoma duodenale]